jgi:MFS superfamily sulfate permease-like transporter
MFEGVLLGLLMAIVKTAWETSHVHLEIDEPDGDGLLCVRVLGNATFLRLPKLLDQLEALPRDRVIRLDLRRLRHLDHACELALLGWAERHNGEGVEPVRVEHRVVAAAPAASGPSQGHPL